MSASRDLETIASIETRAFSAWPAHKTLAESGWLLRISDGYTKRANSVNALAPTGPFPDVLRTATRLYAVHGLPLIFRLSPLAGREPDTILDHLGFRRADETLVMVAPMGQWTAGDPRVTILSAWDESWSVGFAEANGIPSGQRRLHDRILTAITLPTAYAVLREGGQPLGYGMAVAERGMVGIFDIVTAPAARRQGVGRSVLQALLAWGRSKGAREAYLQVVADHEPAQRLYREYGFREIYRYHYRIAPGSG